LSCWKSALGNPLIRNKKNPCLGWAGKCKFLALLRGFWLRVSKGLRAPGLRAKTFRAPGLRHRKIGALGLCGFTLGLHLARIIIFVRAPSSKKPWAPGSTAKISWAPGLQGPPF